MPCEGLDPWIFTLQVAFNILTYIVEIMLTLHGNLIIVNGCGLMVE